MDTNPRSCRRSRDGSQRADGGGSTGKVRAVRRPKRDSAAGSASEPSLCWAPALPHGGFILMLQKNPEGEAVGDQQERHNERRNEVGGSQLPRHEPGVIGLVERVQKIGRAPEIEDPCADNASRA